MILYVLLAGYLPFDENTMVQLFQKIKNADFEYPDWFSEEGELVVTLYIKLCCVLHFYMCYFSVLGLTAV